MSLIDPIQSIAIVGAGGVGCFFGGMLAKSGYDVTLIGRKHHIDAINESGLHFEHIDFDVQIPIKATTNIESIGSADLILVCVKSQDTKETGQLIRPHIKKGALVLSLQNGVDNAEILSRMLGIECFPTIVYVASSMAANGHVKHFGRGELLVGSFENKISDNSTLDMVARLFSKANIPTQVSQNIKLELWSKFLVNCIYNAISAIAKINYAKMVEIEDINQLIEKLTEEFLLIAKREDVDISFEKAMSLNRAISTTMPNQRSSMFQDLSRGKITEIESLNGFIVRKGIDYSIPTPLHETIYSLIKVLEANQLNSN